MSKKRFEIDTEEQQPNVEQNVLSLLIKPIEEQEESKGQNDRETESKTTSKPKAKKEIRVGQELINDKAVEKQGALADRRRVEDKKVVITTNIRGTIIDDIEKTIKKYRQQIDVDYNKAQFYEDGSLKQLAVLKKKIDK